LAFGDDFGALTPTISRPKELEEIFPVECGQVMNAILKVY
jgi:hypothetical protein